MNREMHLFNENACIVMVKWHPRVPHTFLVLLSDGSISVYNPCLQQSPLYTFSVLIDEPSASPVAFSFGTTYGSDAFSVYISYSTGHVTLACPLPLSGYSLSPKAFRLAWEEQNPQLHDWLTLWSVTNVPESAQPRLFYNNDVTRTKSIPLTIIHKPHANAHITTCYQFV